MVCVTVSVSDHCPFRGKKVNALKSFYDLKIRVIIAKEKWGKRKIEKIGREKERKKESEAKQRRNIYSTNEKMNE